MKWIDPWTAGTGSVVGFAFIPQFDRTLSMERQLACISSRVLVAMRFLLFRPIFQGQHMVSCLVVRRALQHPVLFLCCHHTRLQTLQRSSSLPSKKASSCHHVCESRLYSVTTASHDLGKSSTPRTACIEGSWGHVVFLYPSHPRAR